MSTERVEIKPDNTNESLEQSADKLKDAGIDVNTGKVDLGVLQGRPRSEVS